MSNRDPLNLQAIRALCDAATPGPWNTAPEGSADAFPGAWLVMTADADSWHRRGFETCDVAENIDKTDAAFIAAMRTAAPAMLDEIMRLRAELAAERRKVERVKALHESDAFFDGLCKVCADRFPCATIRAIADEEAAT